MREKSSILFFVLLLISGPLILSLPARGATPLIIFSEAEIIRLYALQRPSLPVEMGRIGILKSSPSEVSRTLIKTVQPYGGLIAQWIRQDHIPYLKDSLSLRELRLLVQGLKRSSRTGTPLYEDLNKIKPETSALIQKLGLVESHVKNLKKLYKQVVQYATHKHEVENHQKYGDQPYSYHLKKVHGVLKRFGYGPQDSILGLKLGMAAWLHDVIEDTNATYREVQVLFGTEIADIVMGVTKIEKANNMSALSALKLTYLRTQKIKGARILKLADRIANVEEGLSDLFAGRETKVYKYFNEWKLFKTLLYVPGEADEMWLHLENLVTNPDYSKKFIIERKAMLKSMAAAQCSQLFSI